MQTIFIFHGTYNGVIGDYVKPFCEVVAFEVLPAVRAMVARQLIDRHGLSQKRAAALLGVSQPAISHYKRDLRGWKSGLFRKNPGLRAMAEGIAERMASGEATGQHATMLFCELCKEMRFSGAGCEAHRERYPSLSSCSLCADNRDFYGKPRAVPKGRIKALNRFR